METKTQKALDFLLNGNIKSAMALISKFRLGISKDQKRALEIVNEVMSNPGRIAFYNALDVDVLKQEEIALEYINSFTDGKKIYDKIINV